MHAIKILKLSIKALSKDWGATLRVFGMPFLLSFGLVGAFLIAFGESLIATPNANGTLELQSKVPFLLIFPLIVIAITSWIWGAISWHRYIILGERPSGIAAPFKIDRVFSYMGHSILIAIFVWIVGFLFLLIPLVAMQFAPGAVFAATMFVNVILGTVIIGLSALLPSVAANRSQGFWDVLKAASENVPTLLILSAILYGLLYAPSFFLQYLGQNSVAEILELIAGAVSLYLAVVVATTLYQNWFMEAETS